MSRVYLSLLRKLRLADRRGVVAILFALALVPVVIVVALAVDFSFYIEAGSQLNLAADAAAMHAVRVASQAYSQGVNSLAAAEAAGSTAGQQWFAAQLGGMTTAQVSSQNVSVNVTYQNAPPGFVAAVSYSGVVPTHLGHFIVPSWAITGASSAIVNSAYLEVLMLLDNSSSMLIGATDADITALQNATPCSSQSANEGQSMPVGYSWIYNSPSIGYTDPLAQPPAILVPPAPNPQNGSCDPNYTGTAPCPYPPTYAPFGIGANGLCTNGQGYLGHPQAPCALACHNDANNNDYYGLARSLKPAVTLRLDVVHQAAANVIQTMIADEEVAGQYSVGVYEFNNALQQQYPPPGTGEASTDLAAALSTVQQLNPPLTPNNPQTYFSSSATTLASQVTPAGDGTTQAAPFKNVFIVTDGVEDIQTNGRFIGTIASTGGLAVCQKFKDMGFTVYVLYTPYLPVPNWYYLYGDSANGVTAPRTIAEPTANSQVTQALASCASSPNLFFQASNSADINADMQKMLEAAINGPGRVTK